MVVKLQIDVFNRNQLIESQIHRPIRLSPNDWCAVAYGGSVFELREDLSIDLQDQSFEIVDCNRFLMKAEALRIKHKEDNQTRRFLPFANSWEVEERSGFYYLIFDAPIFTARSLLDYLQSSGIIIQRWDSSRKRSDSGRQYNWFAHITTDLAIEELIQEISRLFSVSQDTVQKEISDDASRLPIEDSIFISEKANQKIAQLENIIEKKSEEISELKFEVSRVRTELQNFKKMYLEIESTLESLTQNKDLKLNKELIESRDFIEYADQEITRLTNELKVLNIENFDLEKENLNLNAQLDYFIEQEQLRTQIQPIFAPKQGTENFIDNAFGRIEFVQESAEVLASFSNPRAALKCLFQLDAGDAIGKDIQGLKGWREISKIQTGIKGLDEQGRIYYKASGNVVYVSVHVKRGDQEQQRHFDSLGRISFED